MRFLSCSESHAVLREGLRPGEGEERTAPRGTRVGKSFASRLDPSSRLIVLFFVRIGRSAVRTIDARRTDTASLVARRS